MKKTVLGLMLLLLDINDLHGNAICKIAIYANDTALYLTCNLASDL